HDEAGGFFARPSMQSAADPALPLTEKAGDNIGRYKLLEQIGEGGCGGVYMAEQQEPVRRRVALKVIKLGMDTKQVVARFEAERQALALMDHPNIARIYDGGIVGSPHPASGPPPHEPAPPTPPPPPGGGGGVPARRGGGSQALATRHSSL